MRPNLTLTGIASALAVLGTTTALVACGGGDKPAVQATDVKSADPAKSADGHCGADHKDHKGDAKCAAKDTASSTAASAAPATTSAPGTTTPATTTAPGATTPAAATPAASAAPASSAKPAGGTPGKAPPKAGGQASCGAGTCSAKK